MSTEESLTGTDKIRRWQGKFCRKACSAINEHIQSNDIALITLYAIEEHT